MSDPVFPRINADRYLNCGILERVPGNVSFLSSDPGTAVRVSTIGFLWDSQARHTAIQNFQPPSYYDDYVMTATYSERMQELQKAQAEKLGRLFDAGPELASFVEIGCGDGSFMKHARKHMGRVVGIEPSRPFAEEAIAAGFEVLIGYVGSAAVLTNEKFDSFASRQVFEHLPDPVDVLIGIRNMLHPGAVGLIEVPNGLRALRLKRFFEFFPDHVNYYSVNSLVALASQAAFTVLGCNETFGGDYLELWLRNDVGIESWFSELVSRRDAICSGLLGTVNEQARIGNKVAVWGAGAKTLSIFSASSPELFQVIDCIIDSDPHKHGRYVPNTSVPVVSPLEGASRKPDVVIVLALSYREEIASIIHKQIPACGLILTLDDVGKIVPL